MKYSGMENVRKVKFSGLTSFLRLTFFYLLHSFSFLYFFLNSGMIKLRQAILCMQMAPNVHKLIHLFIQSLVFVPNVTNYSLYPFLQNGGHITRGRYAGNQCRKQDQICFYIQLFFLFLLLLDFKLGYLHFF